MGIRPNILKHPIRTATALFAGGAIVVGFMGFTDPEPPHPEAGQATVTPPIITHPFLPGGLGAVIAAHAPKGHKQDGEMTLSVYHDEGKGNYAVADYTFVGSAAFTTTMTCVDVTKDNVPGYGLHVVADTKAHHVIGRVVGAPNGTFNDALSRAVCGPNGLTPKRLKPSFDNPNLNPFKLSLPFGY